MQQRPLVFISYRHGDPWTGMAQRLHLRLKNVSRALGFDLFMDDRALSAGDLWDDMLAQQLARTTHFICLLCDEYWESFECQRELKFAVDGFRARRVPRLLFVLAEAMSPEYLFFDDAGRPDRLEAPHERDAALRSVSDVQFLAAFDRNNRLEPLDWASPARLAEQFTQLVARLKATLPAPGVPVIQAAGNRS